MPLGPDPLGQEAQAAEEEEAAPSAGGTLLPPVGRHLGLCDLCGSEGAGPRPRPRAPRVCVSSSVKGESWLPGETPQQKPA